MKRILLGAVLMAAGALNPAAAHRTPEVHLTAEAAQIGGEMRTVMTVRLEAEDALVIAAERYGLDAVLGSEEVLRFVGERAAAKIEAGSPVTYLGGEVDGDLVFLFLAGEEGLEVERTSVLSSVHTYWTNYFEDKRKPGTGTQMFTQSGKIAPHTH